MEIEVLESYREADYEAFLLGSNHSLFYHSLAYRNFLQDLLDCQSEYLIALEGGEIVGCLPLMRKRGSSGDVINSLPYYGSNGGVISDRQDATTGLIDAYNRLTSNANVVSATLVSNPLAAVNYECIEHDYKDYRIGQWTAFDNSTEFDEILRRFESSARRNVNKAFNSGVSVSRDSTKMGVLMRLHRENMLNIGGQAKDPLFFDLVSKYFQAGRDFDVYIAELDGRIIGALLLFYYRDMVEYFTPGIETDYRNLQALPAIIAVAMENAMDRGLKKWNWGGTWPSQEGVYRFKRKWGADDLKYEYFIRLNDSDILCLDREAITATWPGFYVCPFELLENK